MAPTSVDQVPAVHVLHEPEPDSDHVPALQLVHTLTLSAPTAVEKVPASQLEHIECALAPIVVEYVPAAQPMHLVAPLREDQVPAMQ